MVRLALGIILLSLTCCNGRPSSTWTSNPQFTVGVWEIYHDPHFTVQQMNWIRTSVYRHIALSEAMYRSPTYPGQGSGVGQEMAPRWWFNKPRPYTTPKIYVYNQKVKYLNSPIKVGVTAYAKFNREEVHCTMGNKLTMPGLATAVHQLRCGPDPWQQDLTLNWPNLITYEAALVSTLEKSR